MYYYACTARKTNKPITRTHYLDYLNAISDKGKVGNVNFEMTRGMHCHYIIETEQKISHNDLRPTKRGWNVKAIPMYNRKGWIKYCRKDHEANKELNADLHYEQDECIMPTKKLF